MHRSWSRTLGFSLTLVVASAWPGTLQGQTQEAVSVVQGLVREHETGEPLVGAAVSLASGPGGTKGLGTRVTDSEGRFVFRRVPPGSYRLIATFIGFREVRDTLEVGPGSDLELILPMSVSPVPMEPLLVEADRRESGLMADFERRRRTTGGTFFDYDDIQARNPMLFSDLFRLVPGARVVPVGTWENSVRFRGNCQPALWVDGMELMTSEGMDHLLPTMDLEAVEIYKGPNLPVQFGSNSCGAIIVWTRRGEPMPEDGGFWRRLAIAGGLIVFAILMIR